MKDKELLAEQTAMIIFYVEYIEKLLTKEDRKEGLEIMEQIWMDLEGLGINCPV